MEPVWRCWKKESTAVIIPADSVASISCGMENTVLPSDSRGNEFYIGTFVDYQDAVQARQEAESTIHEGFVRAWYSWNRQAEKDPGWARNNPLVYEIQRITESFR